MNVSRRCLLGSVATLALTAASPSLAQLPNKPNIVVMLIDNLGYGELGVYGGGILRGASTPIIDNLASQGMRLLNFNVEAAPTHQVLRLSGLDTSHSPPTIVAARLCHWHVGQMAPRQRRRPSTDQ
jgi:hypothetical protein